MKSWPFKDPDEVLDYDIDWTVRLYSADELEAFNAGDESQVPADSIASSTFTLPPGIVANSSTHTATSTKVWISGGTEGQSYQVQNEIVTAGGRTMDMTVKLKIKTK